MRNQYNINSWTISRKKQRGRREGVEKTIDRLENVCNPANIIHLLIF